MTRCQSHNDINNFLYVRQCPFCNVFSTLLHRRLPMVSPSEPMTYYTLTGKYVTSYIRKGQIALKMHHPLFGYFSINSLEYQWLNLGVPWWRHSDETRRGRSCGRNFLFQCITSGFSYPPFRAQASSISGQSGCHLPFDASAVSFALLK